MRSSNFARAPATYFRGISSRRQQTTSPHHSHSHDTFRDSPVQRWVKGQPAGLARRTIALAVYRERAERKHLWYTRRRSEPILTRTLEILWRGNRLWLRMVQ